MLQTTWVKKKKKHEAMYAFVAEWPLNCWSTKWLEIAQQLIRRGIYELEDMRILFFHNIVRYGLNNGHQIDDNIFSQNTLPFSFLHICGIYTIEIVYVISQYVGQ